MKTCRAWSPSSTIWILVMHFFVQIVSEKAVYRSEFPEVQFQSVNMFYDGKSRGLTFGFHQFLHLAHDNFIKNHVLLVDGYAVFTMHLVTRDLSLIAGNTSHVGYWEAESRNALFSYITSVTSSKNSPNKIWVADAGNSCLRSIDRNSNETSTTAGLCQTTGNVDGSLRLARFGILGGMVEDPKDSNVLYLYDNSFHCLKKINLGGGDSRGRVSTVWCDDFSIQAMAFDLRGEMMFMLTDSGILSMNIKTKALSTVLDQKGHEDGPFVTSRLSGPSSLTFVSENIMVVADSNNYRLRIIDFENKRTTSICKSGSAFITKFHPGSINSCHIYRPTSILLLPNEQRLLVTANIHVYQLIFKSVVRTIDSTEDVASALQAKVGASKSDKVITDDSLLGILGIVVVVAMLAGLALYAFRIRRNGEREVQNFRPVDKQPSERLAVPSTGSFRNASRNLQYKASVVSGRLDSTLGLKPSKTHEQREIPAITTEDPYGVTSPPNNTAATSRANLIAEQNRSVRASKLLAALQQVDNSGPEQPSAISLQDGRQAPPSSADASKMSLRTDMQNRGVRASRVAAALEKVPPLDFEPQSEEVPPPDVDQQSEEVPPDVEQQSEEDGISPPPNTADVSKLSLQDDMQSRGVRASKVVAALESVNSPEYDQQSIRDTIRPPPNSADVSKMSLPTEILNEGVRVSRLMNALEELERQSPEPSESDIQTETKTPLESDDESKISLPSEVAGSPPPTVEVSNFSTEVDKPEFKKNLSSADIDRKSIMDEGTAKDMEYLRAIKKAVKQGERDISLKESMYTANENFPSDT